MPRMHKLSIDGPAVVLIIRTRSNGEIGRAEADNGTIRRVDRRVGPPGYTNTGKYKIHSMGQVTVELTGKNALFHKQLGL